MTTRTSRPSPAFVQAIERAHPDAAAAWLGELPRLQRRLATAWDLTLTQWLPARAACVVRAVTGDGEQAVLKIPVIASDTTSEGAALAYWDGDGAPELLRVDAVSGALLVAWVDGTAFVEEADGTESLRRAGELLRALHRPRPAGLPELPTLEQKLAPWRRSRELQERSSGARRPLDDATLGTEAAVRAWLDGGPRRTGATAIHGDLHPRNLLVRRDGSLAAIDPYGVLGDPCRDAASLALFFREDATALARLEELADVAELERGRVVAHAYALAVGAYRFRMAYGISAGRAFLEDTVRALERRLPVVAP
ncbi:MAG TPA: aminoglycoside phosphotransferase family protein [Solirubrobacteraceae bacterium]|jgi:streptomycin 6-kinase|nr:aminoglycoside phosphotransferase family protein [Solirubrobacteraceae bacterium]